MNQVAIRENGGFSLEPRSLTEAMEIAKMLSDSSMVPANYKGKAADTLVAMMMGKEVGLNPIQSLQNIAVINGRPSIYGDALPALVMRRYEFGGMEETFDDASMTATCVVWRKGGTKHTQRFSQQDASTAKLWGKAGPWTQYPKRMLQMRARGFALRDQFADALAGLITAEEAEDMPTEREVNTSHQNTETTQTAPISRTSALKEKLSTEEVEILDPDEEEGEPLPLAATYAEVMDAINKAGSPETMEDAKKFMMDFALTDGNQQFQEELGKAWRDRAAVLKKQQEANV